jgi:polysaccharide export outer membrane protein
LRRPLVEDLPAIGKDATTLARDIEKALAKYIRDPVVTVIVTGFTGPYSEQVACSAKRRSRRFCLTSRR